MMTKNTESRTVFVGSSPASSTTRWQGQEISGPAKKGELIMSDKEDCKFQFTLREISGGELIKESPSLNDILDELRILRSKYGEEWNQDLMICYEDDNYDPILEIDVASLNLFI